MHTAHIQKHTTESVSNAKRHRSDGKQHAYNGLQFIRNKVTRRNIKRTAYGKHVPTKMNFEYEIFQIKKEETYRKR